MANASRKHFGAGVHDKGDGTGAMTEVDPEAIPANAVLSNRDKAAHNDERGLDAAAIRDEQRVDDAGGDAVPGAGGPTGEEDAS